MAERLFLFVQMEFPWALGPADGRYLLRTRAAEGDVNPDRVVVLNTVGAERRRGRLGTRHPQATPDPAPVPTARATVIDPVPLAAERQARAWLRQLDAEREAQVATAALNRVLFAHRIATADPHARELSPAQALVVRAGWGEGEQMTYGHWAYARELQWSVRRARRRSAVLRPLERFAALLGAREQALLCEELALRARLDVDQGRLAFAALELEQAYTAALVELPLLARADLAERIAELEQLRPGVIAAARAAPEGHEEQAEEEAVRHALTRLEAALRARTAAGLVE